MQPIIIGRSIKGKSINKMYTAETSIRVRYGETDKMGVVYYGNYPLYYEEARTDAIRKLGIPYVKLEEMGVMMPVARMNIKYVMPAKYDELLRVVTIVPELPGRGMTFRMEIYNEADELINIGETMLLFIDSESRKARRAPEVLIDQLKPYFAD
jgi:acyl-CoA thioester hydrolase